MGNREFEKRADSEVINDLALQKAILKAHRDRIMGENVTLKAEVERLRKDAERYQWLRNPAIDPGRVIDKRVRHVGPDGETDSIDWEYRGGDELDAAIDAAMDDACGLCSTSYAAEQWDAALAAAPTPPAPEQHYEEQPDGTVVSVDPADIATTPPAPEVDTVATVLREALVWGMTYGPTLSGWQWGEMREQMVKQFAARINSAADSRGTDDELVHAVMTAQVDNNELRKAAEELIARVDNGGSMTWGDKRIDDLRAELNKDKSC